MVIMRMVVVIVFGETVYVNDHDREDLANYAGGHYHICGGHAHHHGEHDNAYGDHVRRNRGRYHEDCNHWLHCSYCLMTLLMILLKHLIRLVTLITIWAVY